LAAVSLYTRQNNYGKNTFETLVRFRFADRGWVVPDKGIQIKKGKCALTDIDLVAYKNNILILAQIKVAHCGYTPYQKWKAEKTVKIGILQCNKVMEYVENNTNEFKALMKNSGILPSDFDDFCIVPLVITGSNLFSGMPNKDSVSVVGIEILDILLSFYENSEDEELILSLKNPLQGLTDVVGYPEIKYSKIEIEGFNLLFEEIE